MPTEDRQFDLGQIFLHLLSSDRHMLFVCHEN
jgi:hypothetical protein